MAFERFLTGVFAKVASQLIRPSKLPRTALPGADVRFLPCVRPLVSLEVRAFGVHFSTTYEFTTVDLLASCLAAAATVFRIAATALLVQMAVTILARCLRRRRRRRQRRGLREGQVDWKINLLGNWVGGYWDP